MSMNKERYSTADAPDYENEPLDGDAYVDHEEYDEELAEDEEYGDVEVEEFEEEDQPRPRSQTNMPLVLAAVGGAVLVLGLIAFMFMRSGSTADAGTGNGTGTAVASGGQGIDPNVERPQTGYLAPDFTLAGVNGGTVKLSSYRGQKAVWLNFWATWCAPCRVEMPAMEKLYPEYKAKGVEIIGVDVGENIDGVKQYIQQGSYSWLFALDPEQIGFRRYYSTGIPTHAFIKKDGRISSIIIGGLPDAMMTTELEKMLQ